MEAKPASISVEAHAAAHGDGLAGHVGAEGSDGNANPPELRSVLLKDEYELAILMTNISILQKMPVSGRPFAAVPNIAEALAGDWDG